MTREAAIKVFRQLLDAFDNCEHGDYFYDFGDMVCEAANVAIAALREQPQWISVEERLPEDDVQVLACTKHGKAFSAHCERGRWRVSGSVKVTHWMPLPEAPEVEV